MLLGQSPARAPDAKPSDACAVDPKTIDPQRDNFAPKKLKHVMRNGILETNAAVIASERSLTVNGRSGRELRARAKGYSIRAWLFVWSDRSMNVSVVGPEPELAQAAIDEFFASFEIVKE